MNRSPVLLIILPIVLFLLKSADASASRQPDDLTELSIEELADLEVTTVAKKTQKISQSAAAVYVITSEDIRRSGATCIPEVLRMVPGLEVAKINTRLWAISARGFNGTYANKLLVLFDGRTVYSPVFSGVFWFAQDTLLEDIDRIEVIRGPGASLWGANAVNGVINIITKHTQDTKGGMISTGFGTEERTIFNTRYGGEFKKNNTYRIYAKGFISGESVDLDNNPVSDDYCKIQAGFRTDQTMSDQDEITLQGDISKAEINELASVATYIPPLYSSTIKSENPSISGNILGRWTHRFDTDSDLSLQIYYDSFSFTNLVFSIKTDIIDLDFQHRLQVGQRQEIVWGAGYRFYSDDSETCDLTSYGIEQSDIIFMDPENLTSHLFSFFLQDEISIIENRLFLTLGSKIEHNDFTGFEYQPNARILFLYNQHHTFWAAISRATRCPSRTEHDIFAVIGITPPSADMNPYPFPGEISFFGNEDIKSETLIGHELGYRMQTHSHIKLDITVFSNKYDNLSDYSFIQPYFQLSPTRIVMPILLDNILEGSSRGCEFSACWQPHQNLHLQAGYTYLDMNLEKKDGKTTVNNANINRFSPTHQVFFNTGIDLPLHLEADLWFRYVDDILDGLVEHYTTMDAHLAWKPRPSLTFTVVGKDLLDQSHVEFIEETGRIDISQVERSIYAGIKWIF